MAAAPSTPAPLGAGAYPPPVLADLVVQMLAATPGNAFTPLQALQGNQSALRGVVASQGCCPVINLPEAVADAPENLFYFGRDKDGYIIVTARRALPGWPSARKGPKPIRLARWLVQAAAGEVVRHTCDTPSCVRVDHLRRGEQAENLGDAIRRGRRRRIDDGVQTELGLRRVRQSTTEGGASSEASAATAAASDTAHDSIRSPSKLARRRAREAAGASGAAR